MPSLDEIVSSAVADAPAEIEKSGVPIADTPDEQPSFIELKNKEATVVPNKEGNEEEEEEIPGAVDEKVDDLGLSDAEIMNARNLFAALKDPTKAPIVVELLAKANGYEKPETKKEAIKIAQGMTEELKEVLGPELEYLADKMGPIFEKQLKAQVDQVRNETATRISEIELKEWHKVAIREQNALAREYFKEGVLPDKLAQSMVKVMETYKAEKGQSMREYIEDVMALAARRTGTTLTKISVKPTDNRVDRNRNDAISRLASDGANRTPKPGITIVPPKVAMSLDDAVRAATSKAAELMEK